VFTRTCSSHTGDTERQEAGDPLPSAKREHIGSPGAEASGPAPVVEAPGESEDLRAGASADSEEEMGEEKFEKILLDGALKHVVRTHHHARKQTARALE
jgi:hypothetical protein